MGVQVNLRDVVSGFLSADALNANNDLVEQAFNKALDRTSNVDNAMETDLDMGGYGILNYGVNPDILDPDKWDNPELDYNLVPKIYVDMRDEYYFGITKAWVKDYTYSREEILALFEVIAGDFISMNNAEPRIIAAGGETTIPLTVVRYTPGTYSLFVFLNGVAQRSVIDYSEPSNASIRFNKPLMAGDIVDIYMMLVSKDIAEAAKEAAEAVADLANWYKDFRRSYYGSLASNPTTDPFGFPPIEGALYFNSTAKKMRTYSSGVWWDVLTATTVMKDPYVVVGYSGVQLSYLYSPGYLLVFKNGLLLNDVYDYTANNGYSIDFNDPIVPSDEVVVIAFEPGDNMFEAITEKIKVKDVTDAVNYTLQLADGGSLIRMSNLDGNTITVPSHGAVPFNIGTIVSIRQMGEGNTTVIADPSVKINFAPGEEHKTIGYIDGTVSIVKVKENEWDFVRSYFGLIANNNLADLMNFEEARENLDVYSKEEIDDLVGEGVLLAENNLDDLDDVEIARDNLDVYSKSEVDAAIGAGGTIPEATTTQKGIIRLATHAEVSDGINGTAAVTPSGLASLLGSSFSIVVHEGYQQMSFALPGGLIFKSVFVPDNTSAVPHDGFNYVEGTWHTWFPTACLGSIGGQRARHAAGTNQHVGSDCTRTNWRLYRGHDYWQYAGSVFAWGY